MITEFKDMVLDTKVRENLESYIKTKNLPNLLFVSPNPGTGKTTTADIIVKQLEESHDVLRINGSSDNGVDYVRNTVSPFVNSIGFKTYKIIYIGEADYLTANAQASLRELMEIPNVSFIMTANFNKFIDPILSRCTIYDYSTPDPVAIAKHLKKLYPEVLNNQIMDIVKLNYPDIRAMKTFIARGIFDMSNDNNEVFKELIDNTVYSFRFKKVKRFSKVEMDLFINYLAEHSEELGKKDLTTYLDALNTMQFRHTKVPLQYLNILDFLHNNIK